MISNCQNFSGSPIAVFRPGQSRYILEPALVSQRFPKTSGSIATHLAVIPSRGRCERRLSFQTVAINDRQVFSKLNSRTRYIGFVHWIFGLDFGIRLCVDFHLNWDVWFYFAIRVLNSRLRNLFPLKWFSTTQTLTAAKSRGVSAYSRRVFQNPKIRQSTHFSRTSTFIGVIGNFHFIFSFAASPFRNFILEWSS